MAFAYVPANQPGTEDPGYPVDLEYSSAPNAKPQPARTRCYRRVWLNRVQCLANPDEQPRYLDFYQAYFGKSTAKLRPDATFSVENVGYGATTPDTLVRHRATLALDARAPIGAYNHV